jgi:hypothetical protein
MLLSGYGIDASRELSPACARACGTDGCAVGGGKGTISGADGTRTPVKGERCSLIGRIAVFATAGDGSAIAPPPLLLRRDRAKEHVTRRRSGADGTRTRNLRRDRATIQPIDLQPRCADAPYRSCCQVTGRRSNQLIYSPADRTAPPRAAVGVPYGLPLVKCQSFGVPLPPSHFSLFTVFRVWAMQDLNLRHPPCKGGALPLS